MSASCLRCNYFSRCSRVDVALLQDRAILPTVKRIKTSWRSEIPEELDVVRHKARDCDGPSWYLIVSEFEGKAVELFMSTAHENDFDAQSSIANFTALTRQCITDVKTSFLGRAYNN